MIYAIYLLLVPCSLLITLIAVLLAPILPVFAKPIYGWCDNHNYEAIEPRLPSWLGVFQTADNSLDGDATFKRLNPPSYLSKIKWLIRNPAPSFALKYLSAPYSTKVLGDPTIRDNDNAKEGQCLVISNGLFQLRIVKRIFSTNRCIYCDFGWSIMGLADPKVDPKPQTWQAFFLFSPRISGFR